MNEEEGDDIGTEEINDAADKSETGKGGEVQKVNDDEQKPKKKKKKRQQLFICLTYCKYECGKYSTPYGYNLVY